MSESEDHLSAIVLVVMLVLIGGVVCVEGCLRQRDAQPSRPVPAEVVQ